jgi:hypothetical protein
MTDLLKLVNNQRCKWHRCDPASSENIKALTQAVQFPLPESYLEFLKISNGGEGILGIEPGWFQIWSASEVIELNRAYSIDEFIPGFFGFGSNGGEELLALKIIKPDAPVFMIPFIPLSESEAQQIAPNFDAFLIQLGRQPISNGLHPAGV